jgi:hypothetical protein
VGACDAYENVRAEFSTHDQDKCWFIWYDCVGTQDVERTTNWWTAWDTVNNVTNYWGEWRAIHHPYVNNEDDNFGLYGCGQTAGGGAGVASITRCLQDRQTCNHTDLTDYDVGDQVRQLGSCMWVANHYWALTGPRTGHAATFHFYVSDEGTVWTEQIDFDPLVVRHVMDWPVNPDRFYACCDGGPIMVSTDRGLNWANKAGNWGAVGGGAGSIVCGDVARPVAYLP